MYLATEIDQAKKKADRQESHAEKWKDTGGAARIKRNAALNHAKAAEAELAIVEGNYRGNNCLQGVRMESSMDQSTGEYC